MPKKLKNMKVKVQNMKDVQADLKVVQERLQILAGWIRFFQNMLNVPTRANPLKPGIGPTNPSPPPGP
jgi:hypothetical protein